MEPEINLEPKDLYEQPLGYSPNGSPLRIGLTTSFYFSALQSIELRRALMDLSLIYLQQSKDMLCMSYLYNRDEDFQDFKPENIPELEARMAALVPYAEFPFDFAARGDGVSDSWSIHAYLNNINSDVKLGFLHLTFPLTILKDASLCSFIQQFVSTCNRLQVEHAYGGFGLIGFGRGWSTAHRAISEAAMRFPGLDLEDPGEMVRYCEQGIKSVNFLTAVSDRLLAKVGGSQAVAAQAGAGIEVHPYSTGAVFQAGPVPQIGDTTRGFLPDRYVALGRALKPLRAPYPDTLLYDPTGKDSKAFTQRWLARFDGEGS